MPAPYASTLPAEWGQREGVEAAEPYPGAALLHCLAFAAYPIQGMHTAVLGSITPWCVRTRVCVDGRRTPHATSAQAVGSGKAGARRVVSLTGRAYGCGWRSWVRKSVDS